TGSQRSASGHQRDLPGAQAGRQGTGSDPGSLQRQLLVATLFSVVQAKLPGYERRAVYRARAAPPLWTVHRAAGAQTAAPPIPGAGPVGLEAALYARTLNLPVTVYERGRIGEHVQRWGHVRLFSPFGMNTTPLGRAAIIRENSQHSFPTDSDCTTGKEHITT